MKKLAKVLMVVFFSLLWNCPQVKSMSPIEHEVKLVDITSRIDKDELFADIFLKIVSESKTDTTHIYVAKGMYKGKVVGLKLEVKSNLNPGITADKKISREEGFNVNGVRIQSIGDESNNFIAALSELYECPTSKPFSSNPVAATVFSMGMDTVNLDKVDDYKFKLFLGENNTDSFSELYLNLNLKKGEIELPEKDISYRKSLIGLMTK